MLSLHFCPFTFHTVPHISCQSALTPLLSLYLSYGTSYLLPECSHFTSVPLPFVQYLISPARVLSLHFCPFTFCTVPHISCQSALTPLLSLYLSYGTSYLLPECSHFTSVPLPFVQYLISPARVLSFHFCPFTFCTVPHISCQSAIASLLSHYLSYSTSYLLPEFNHFSSVPLPFFQYLLFIRPACYHFSPFTCLKYILFLRLVCYHFSSASLSFSTCLVLLPECCHFSSAPLPFFQYLFSSLLLVGYHSSSVSLTFSTSFFFKFSVDLYKIPCSH